MSQYGNNSFNKSYGSGQRAAGEGGGGGYNNSNSGNSGGGYSRPNNGGGYNNNGGGSGYNKGGGGGYNKGGYNKPQQPVDPDPYIPVVMFANQDPPLEVIGRFKEISKRLAELGCTVRVAGGNNEADDAARDNAGTKVEEYLPWKNFGERPAPNYFSDEVSVEQACKYHPAASMMKDAAKKFLSRNLRMVQGQKLRSPAKLIIVWSDDGATKLADKSVKSGNSGHFVSMAAGLKTLIFNIGKEGTFEKLMEYLVMDKEPERQQNNNNNNQQRRDPPQQQQQQRYSNDNSQKYKNDDDDSSGDDGLTEDYGY